MADKDADAAHGDQWMDIADAIAVLRGQMAEAQARLADPNGPGDEGVIFEVGEVTVELGMELARTGGANGGLRFSVLGLGVDAGGKREKTNSATHKVTLQLTPRRADGRGQVEVGEIEEVK